MLRACSPSIKTRIYCLQTLAIYALDARYTTHVTQFKIQNHSQLRETIVNFLLRANWFRQNITSL